MLKHYREDKLARDNQPTKIESEKERDSGIPRVLFYELLVAATILCFIISNLLLTASYFRDVLINSLPF